MYNVTSAASKSITYTVEIGLKQSCTCAWFLKNNTPCKHLIWVLVFCLKVPEDSDLIYQMGLTVEEFDQINGKSRERSDNDSVSNKNRRKSGTGGKNTKSPTLKSLLKTTSTPKPIAKLLPKVPAGRKLQDLPQLPEPQTDPYWVFKKEGQIKKCHGCKGELNEIYVLGRIELDYYPKLYPDASKQWLLSEAPRYYHVNATCIQLRQRDYVFKRGDLRIGDGIILTDDMKEKLAIK